MRMEIFEELLPLAAWDTHTHLESSPKIGARDIWDIVHYFWLRQELEAAGYPAQAEKLPEPERVEALAKAFSESRTTHWNRIVRRMLKDLYGVTIDGTASIHDANERIKANAADPAWPRQICARGSLFRIVAGITAPNDLASLAGIIHSVPVFDRLNDRVIDAVLVSQKQADKAAEVAAELDSAVGALYDQGIRTVRIAPYPFDGMDGAAKVPVLAATGNTRDAVRLVLGHALFSSLARRSLHVQLFTGVRRRPTIAVSVNDTERIPRMNEIFEKYPTIIFEVLNAAELSAVDLVQSARARRNVYCGAPWWFSVRASIIRANMQYRIEALPVSRSLLLASDARVIEWVYAKTIFVKLLLADFLSASIERDWLDRADALYAASWWLSKTAERIYREDAPAKASVPPN
ncbi:MAG: hypothetical protein AABZ39_04515 [Spirochaetota bacterium]